MKIIDNTPAKCSACEGAGLDGGENFFNDACPVCGGTGELLNRKPSWKAFWSIFGGQTKQPDQ